MSSLSALAGRRTEYFDEELPGFSVRVAPSGSKSFSVLYRRGRRLRRYTLGRYPILSFSQARALARKALARAALGEDPGERKIEERRAETFAELCREYLERYARPRKKTWREDERRIQKTLVPHLGYRRAAEVRRGEVSAVLESIVHRGAGIEANRTHALIRKIYNWAISVDLVEQNPCALLSRPARERMRFHVMSEDEVCRFWVALDGEKERTAAVLRLMLLTAQRGGEVIGMRWEELELSAGWWTIPAERSKNGLSHRVPLSDRALGILEEVRSQSDPSPWVFPSKKTSGHWSGLQKALQRTRHRAGIALRGHDLRRTAASFMTSMGTPRLVVARILNHAETGITAVYDRHSYDREKREALDAWARRLAEILTKVVFHV